MLYCMFRLQVLHWRIAAGYALAMAKMKVLLALVAHHYHVAIGNDTEWVTSINKVPKVGTVQLVVQLPAECDKLNCSAVACRWSLPDGQCCTAHGMSQAVTVRHSLADISRHQ